MLKLFRFIASHPKSVLVVLTAIAALGVNVRSELSVDVFPDISVPRVTIQTEAGGLTAEEVEQLVTIPIETAVNGIPGISTIRSSSGGGLSFVWADFDWNVDLSRARFDVFERLSRVRETLPSGVDCEISPVVSVTGEIMLIALTAKEGGMSSLELRELAEYDLRLRLLGIAGIGEVAVMGGRLPEYRISVDPRRLAEHDISISDVVDAARDTRTYASAGYLSHVGGEEHPIRQLARADNLAAIKKSAIPLSSGASLRIGDVSDVTLSGAPRRGSASFNGNDAVVLSVQKSPGGNTPELTKKIERLLNEFRKTVSAKGVEVHSEAYRQADFIAASVNGGSEVLRDAVIVVVAILLITLLELRTIVVVLCTMPLSILMGLVFFPVLGIGINVMTLGGFAVAAGDIVDAAIIFTEVVRRKLSENKNADVVEVIASSMKSVAPGVLFSTAMVALVFLPLMLLDGLEGKFFRPLALAYLSVFVMSLFAASTAVPALARLLNVGMRATKKEVSHKMSFGIRAMRALYNPFLMLALKLPKTVVLVAILAASASIWIAKDFGSSFLPPFREDSFNVMLSLPPGASLDETERVCESCVPVLREIDGVLSVTRRTGRAERDQHAEPVSSSEYVVRIDLKADTDAIKKEIREKIGKIPGCSLLVGYPIAHRIGAVLSGTEAELAVNVFGEDIDVLRDVVAKMKNVIEAMPQVSDVRANREVTVRSLRIDYDADSLLEAGLTLREAGEQVAAAFNGVDVGDVRDGIRTRSVVVRLSGCESADAEAVKGLLLTGRTGRRVRLDDVARVVPEEASNLMLREGARRKALISCNAADGVSIGDLVEELREHLEPIAVASGCTVSFGGSYEARESAAKRLGILGIVIVAAVFLMLVFALKSVRCAMLALLNVPLGLIGAVMAVAIANPVLSVSSLVGFVTVIGFVLRNGLLLLNCYQDRVAAGSDVMTAVREGSMERMAPIVMTSLTTVFGLVPIMLASSKSGGELLAPLAVVQFGGLLGATILNLVVLPAASILMLTGTVPIQSDVSKVKSQVIKTMKSLFLIFTLSSLFIGCRSYESRPIDWESEVTNNVSGEIKFAGLEEVERVALIGNPDLNLLRLKLANSKKVAKDTGWWEDPELDFDALHFLKPGDHPFLTGGSISMTLPLSGVPGCEKKAAEFYSEADGWAVRASEADVRVEARRAAVRLSSIRERVRILEEYESDAKMKRAFEQAEKLQAAGEVTAGELAAARRRRHARLHRLRSLAGEAYVAESDFIKLLGLMPGVKIDLPLKELHNRHGDDSHHADPVQLIQHPKVKEALARLNADESAFEAEIRRQYPELKVGPAYEREEGIDRLGIVAGLTLPLWNRNRKAIAQAEGTRDESRMYAINTWRDLVRNSHAQHANLDNLLKHPPAPATEREQAEKLSEAGELSAIDYLALREEICDLELEECEWRAEVCEAEEELKRYETDRL